MRNVPIAGNVLKPTGAMFSSRQALCGMGSAECRAGNAELAAKEGEFEVCERGVLVKRGDAEGFAKGLQYLLEHPDVRRKMGQRGREYAMERHSKERLVSDMDRLYQSLLAESRAERRKPRAERG